jgi:hypothetical protein
MNITMAKARNSRVMTTGDIAQLLLVIFGRNDAAQLSSP